MRGVLVDAGPLVALIDAADPDHDVCVDTLEGLRDPLITAWPAFTEAMYLLRDSWRGQKALWSRLETDALTLAALDSGDAPRMRELMEKYRDLPMDLADAALVRIAEREGLTRIFTLDRRHFSIYVPDAVAVSPSCRRCSVSDYRRSSRKPNACTVPSSVPT